MTSLDGLENYRQFATDQNWEGLLKEVDQLVKDGKMDLALRVTDQLFIPTNPKDRAYRMIFGYSATGKDVQQTIELAKKAFNKNDAFLFAYDDILYKIDELLEKGLKENNKEFLEEALKLGTSYIKASGFEVSHIIQSKIALAYLELGDDDTGNKIANMSDLPEVIRQIADKNPWKAELLLNKNVMSNSLEKVLRCYIQIRYAHRYAEEENLTEVNKYDKAISDFYTALRYPDSYDYFLRNIAEIFAKKNKLDWAEMFRKKIKRSDIRDRGYPAPAAPPPPFPKPNIP